MFRILHSVNIYTVRRYTYNFVGGIVTIQLLFFCEIFFSITNVQLVRWYEWWQGSKALLIACVRDLTSWITICWWLGLNQQSSVIVPRTLDQCTLKMWWLSVSNGDISLPMYFVGTRKLNWYCNLNIEWFSKSWYKYWKRWQWNISLAMLTFLHMRWILSTIHSLVGCEFFFKNINTIFSVLNNNGYRNSSLYSQNSLWFLDNQATTTRARQIPHQLLASPELQRQVPARARLTCRNIC